MSYDNLVRTQVFGRKTDKTLFSLAKILQDRICIVKNIFWYICSTIKISLLIPTLFCTVFTTISLFPAIKTDELTSPPPNFSTLLISFNGEHLNPGQECNKFSITLSLRLPIDDEPVVFAHGVVDGHSRVVCGHVALITGGRVEGGLQLVLAQEHRGLSAYSSSTPWMTLRSCHRWAVVVRSPDEKH